MADAYVLFDRITHQLLDWEEEGGPGAPDSIRWESVGIEDTLEERLPEFEGLSSTDATSQNEWMLMDLHEIANHPHRSCISCHAVPDVIGPMRSELMILTGMMIIRMRRKEEPFLDDDTFPILMLSIIGRETRLIQAHIVPEEQRVKVSYSQLFDFDHCPQQETLDLIWKWLLSEPVSNEVVFIRRGRRFSSVSKP
ncbi:hypothetical protein GJ744_011937 [Endocarpon pusillum]|uniref:Uncharacterized protein n=1 Tax=Endocarpon pusillum TaxID=364733 RepID=A0A8H7AR59_9EURO|nr:hypothetical protein GJ744_011937 [Endocarpon pusillum]